MSKAYIKGKDSLKSNVPGYPSDVSGHVLLANIHQQQDHQVSVEITAGSVEYLRGPVDMIKWKEVHTFHDAIKAAIVRAGLAPAERLVSAPYLLHLKSGWNPGIQLWSDASGNHEIDIQKVDVVVQAVLAGLQRDAANDAADIFCDAELDSVQQHAVHDVIQETLVSAGGKKLAQPLHVQSGQRSQLIKGKLGAKPSRANFHPEEVILKGVFDGFSLEKRELTFKSDEKMIHINFEKEIVSLVEIAKAASEKRMCVVRTHRTISLRGEDVFAYLPEGVFRLSGV